MTGMAAEMLLAVMKTAGAAVALAQAGRFFWRLFSRQKDTSNRTPSGYSAVVTDFHVGDIKGTAAQTQTSVTMSLSTDILQGVKDAAH